MSEVTPKPIDLQVHSAADPVNLARFRTSLALDRTTLAWIRTTLSIAGFGFGMVGFFRALKQQSPSAESIRLHTGAIRFGTTLVVFGIVSTVLAALSHWRSLRRLQRGENPVLTHWPMSITLALMLSILGLVGLWFMFEQ
jgi:putative membrane protein